MAKSKRAPGLDLDLELQALSANMLAEERTWYISQKQVTTLASMIGSGLEDKSRKNRLNVLRLLCQDAVFTKTGYVIESTKQIPGEIASILIDLLKENVGWELSEYGKQLLVMAEERTKAGALSQEN